MVSTGDHSGSTSGGGPGESSIPFQDSALPLPSILDSAVINEIKLLKTSIQGLNTTLENTEFLNLNSTIEGLKSSVQGLNTFIQPLNGGGQQQRQLNRNRSSPRSTRSLLFGPDLIGSSLGLFRTLLKGKDCVRDQNPSKAIVY
ncbi:unnamed protein product [Cuscuta campestris]|uniref:Uncharacterized protein n=1 Tax=Cuscuta campestris TaxID=132261 RepID=A0A484NDP9_9ASTE|nr:unnamed protein product [Cuscuta campestris]